MWFGQYGRLWAGPWFFFANVPPAVLYAAGIMMLADLPAATMTTRDDTWQCA
jgi:hypothetical protein